MSKKRNLLLLTLLRCFFAFTLLVVVSSCSSDDNPIDVPEEGQPEPPETGTENGLTLISVNTNGVTIPDEPKIDAKLTITTDGQVVHTGDIGVEIRGSSSQFFPKKSYGVETWDSDGMDINVSLLGMPEEEDWILHGPYSDKSLIRNMLIYDLSRDMNRYASRTQFVELDVNSGKKGVYVFMEKLKRNDQRININKLKPDENSGEDLTGGYIIKIDKNDKGGYTPQNSFNSVYPPSNSTMGQEIRFLYEYPDEDDITVQQRDYISTYVANFEAALASDDFADPTIGYANYIDVDSFIDFFILNEISNNVDGYRISTYMHKDKNGKLNMGPIWDFNLAFGNADYCGGGETNVWAYKFNERCPDDFWAIPFWWDRLLEDPAFVAKLKSRWNELRGSTLADAAIFGKVDSYVTTLTDSKAVATNFGLWPILGSYVWPNNFIGNNYGEEITYLKQWVSARTLWLDDSIAAL
ncbi:hypothetical protein FEE95_01090 [Maribacter algarum]|uniref:CotH protein n=1 Tax=Maribacter algarum (ex Zhang et al. 2020) TaxID=2578118 RepID=A0A5S3PV34_9FLAO|nr:CotH kinase family protein [Maribacter algarum]TMM58052.1 hypothetical protein FEE95_01090 [Maribacter algarum]